MNLVAAIWIASLAGALLFTTAGFLWGRLRAWADLAASDLAFAETVPMQPVPAVASGPERPPRPERPERDLGAEARAEARDLRAQLSAATSEIERLRACEAKIDALEHARADLTRERDTLARRAAEAVNLRAKVDDLTQRLTAAERQCAEVDKLRGAERSRRELAIEAEVLKARLADADHVRDENSQLRAASRESLQLRAKVRDLEERLENNAPDLDRTDRVPLAAARAAKGPARFRDVLDRLAAHPSVRAATVADDLGFPVETIGDHAEALAALSGYLIEVANKARELLSLSAIRRVVVVDDAENTVTTSRYRTEYGLLALVTLSEGPCPSWEPSVPESGSRPRAAARESTTATIAK
jgi:hypothetical protein